MNGPRRRFLYSLIALAATSGAGAAPIPPPKKLPSPARWGYEVDLVKLPEDCGYDLEIHLLAAPGGNLGLTTRVKAGTTRAALRKQVLNMIKDSGWRISASGETAVFIEGIERDGYRAASRVEGEAKVLPWNRQPSVRRLMVR